MTPKQIVQKWVEAFNKKDIETLSKLYAYDAINHQVNTKPLQGNEAITNMFAEEFTKANMACVVENIFEDGDWAMLEWSDPLGLQGCGFFNIENDKIKFQRGYWDRLTFLQMYNLPLPKNNKRQLAMVTVVVSDYDEAIQFYIEKLNFTLIEDTWLTEAKRWVRVAPAADNTFCLLLAKANGDEQTKSIGNQTGGRVFLFLYTDDFWRDYKSMSDKGVTFIRNPLEEQWGTVAVFKDLYGNLWDLIQTKK